MIAAQYTSRVSKTHALSGALYSSRRGSLALKGLKGIALLLVPIGSRARISLRYVICDPSLLVLRNNMLPAILVITANQQTCWRS